MHDPASFDFYHFRFPFHLRFDVQSPQHPAELVYEPRRLRKPLMPALHDLHNPPQPDRGAHVAALGVPVPAADEVESNTRDDPAMLWRTKASLHPMPRGASVIGSASVQGHQRSPHVLGCAMIKSAITCFARSLAQMLAERGIPVDVIAPGPVRVPLIPATMPHPTKLGGQSPLGRPARPTATASAHVFLGSARASYITGEIVDATGGTLLP
ncbi:SDR family oxidoreductase [Streptomyces sp. NPDC004788]